MTAVISSVVALFGVGLFFVAFGHYAQNAAIKTPLFLSGLLFVILGISSLAFSARNSGYNDIGILLDLSLLIIIDLFLIIVGLFMLYWVLSSASTVFEKKKLENLK